LNIQEIESGFGEKFRDFYQGTEKSFSAAQRKIRIFPD